MSNGSCGDCQEITVLEWQHGHGWRDRRVSSEYFHTGCCDGLPSLFSGASQVCVILASANKIRSCRPCRQYFIDAFRMPTMWWSEYCRNSNGYFGCEMNDTATDLRTWAYFEIKQLDEKMQYEWYKINVFLRWLPSSRQTVALIFDAPSPTIGRMPDLLLDPELDQFDDPFWVYTRIVAEVVHLEDAAVWAVRGQVRAVELERRPVGRPQPDYRRLHDIARHATHVSETLDVAAQTIRYMLLRHGDLMGSVATKGISRGVHSRLQVFESIVGSLGCRSASNEKRLLNEIQLAFNTVAQYDAGTSVEIGRAAQSDSAAMKTIAFVTLAFLPPTFISTLFSMSFFDYTIESGWTVSGKLWVYWAFAIPTTLVTVMLWSYYNRNSAYGLDGDRRREAVSSKEGIK